MGFSVYANASYNIARLTNDTTTNDTWVPLTPNRLSAIGLLYRQGAWQGSLIERYVGRRFGDTGDTYPLGGYGTADAAVNYYFGPWGRAVKDAKVGVTMENITNRKSIYFLNGYSAGATPPGYINGNPMFFTLPGRSVQLNLSASF
jgi:iron complex outermembrane receptor protein